MSRQKTAKDNIPSHQNEQPQQVTQSMSQDASAAREWSGARLGPSTWMHMQRTVGNRSAVQMMNAFSRAPETSPLQLRGDNPYARVGTHEDWEQTAHHIVAHSQLIKAYERLDNEEKKEVLRHSIPDKLTVAMLDNLKVDLEDSEEARAALRERLVGDESDNETVSNIRLGDIRMSFFEWQGGNQFQGPNTLIRPEPSSSKDDIDYDGHYFSGMDPDSFGTLTTLGEKLSDEQEAPNTKAHLKAILDLTRNRTPEQFDGSQWVEITSLDELNSLSNNADLNRDHILNYAYFKLPLNEMGEGKKYERLKGEFGDFYYDRNKIDVQVKGINGFISVSGAKAVVPKEESLIPLTEVLLELGIDVDEADEKTYWLNVEGRDINIEGRRFVLGDYDNEKIPFIEQRENKLKVAKGMADNKKLKVVKEMQSLYQYCEEKGMQTSSFLPKALYDKLQQPNGNDQD